MKFFKRTASDNASLVSKHVIQIEFSLFPFKSIIVLTIAISAISDVIIFNWHPLNAIKVNLSMWENSPFLYLQMNNSVDFNKAQTCHNSTNLLHL